MIQSKTICFYSRRIFLHYRTFFGLLVFSLSTYIYFHHSKEGYQFDSLPVPKSMFSLSPSQELLSHDNYTKWIVITTINYPTEQVKKLAGISGWKLLVVADKKTPKDWNCPNVTFLDIKFQINLGYKVTELLPWNSYTRKVIGYIYAIQHGAQYIYDTDDDNAPDNVLRFERDFVLGSKTSGLIPSAKDFLLVNPYAHFGQDTVWPRGYPLDRVMLEHNHTYKVCDMKTPMIQQGIVNGDPDVDAIFRLTRKAMHSPLNIQFDNHAPPIVLPRSLFSPFNSQNTMFHYEAFWALMLPTTVTFRVTDIWRGYWAQPLLWKIGGSLGFYPPHTTQIRNAHAYLRDFENENQLYTQAGKLIDILSNWTCDQINFYNCVMDISSLLVSEGQWLTNELSYIQAWIEDLQAIGYKEPQLLNSTANEICSEGNSNFLQFYGVGKKEIDQQHDKDRIPLRKFCAFNFSISSANATVNIPTPSEASTNLTFQSSQPTDASEQLPPLPPIVFNSTLLLITFNHPFYENIWLLESIYRPHFSNILYCGTLMNLSLLDDLVKSDKFKNASVTKFSFIAVNVKKGIFGYECVLKAIQMKYSAVSYLMLSDDILLNFWNNGKFPSDEIWMYSPNTLLLNTEIVASNWNWWNSWWGINATKCALDRMTKESPTNQFFREFLSNREEFGYNSTTVPYGESDIIFCPASKQEIFYEVGNILRECEVFLEIAVPMLGSGISAPDKLVTLPGSWIWGAERDNVFSYFNSSHSVIHAVKIGLIMKDDRLRMEYCDKYIRNVLDH